MHTVSPQGVQPLESSHNLNATAITLLGMHVHLLQKLKESPKLPFPSVDNRQYTLSIHYKDTKIAELHLYFIQVIARNSIEARQRLNDCQTQSILAKI